MENITKLNPLGSISVKEAKERFTEINRIVSEKEGAVIVTKRGNPSTMIVSMKLLKKLIGDEAFKELLFSEYYPTEIENRIDLFLEGKEKTISLEELKKKAGK